MLEKIRPQVLLAILSLSIVAVIALLKGNSEAVTASIGTIGTITGYLLGARK